LLTHQAERAQQKDSGDVIEYLNNRAASLSERSDDIKKFADAAQPLYASLDERQKRRFANELIHLSRERDIERRASLGASWDREAPSSERASNVNAISRCEKLRFQRRPSTRRCMISRSILRQDHNQRPSNRSSMLGTRVGFVARLICRQLCSV
jgi:hypothetical protein